ncbi:MAG: sulfatase-like hydrolase/transferase [Chitinophagales bacterium]|nr:sulfatase-like hydrolase/transferase [Chitinophagales bacterium]
MVSDITPCGVTLHWSPSTGAKNYKVCYRKSGEASWSPKLSVGTETDYTFNDLEKGKTYELSVRSFCIDGSKSPMIKKNVTLPLCEEPSNISVSFPSNQQAKIKFQTNCNFDTAYCRYGLSKSNLNLKAFSLSKTISLNGLNSGQTYYFQISACPLALKDFTDIDSFNSSIVQPNILLIVLDDARFDTYGCNGAPSWFTSPNIDRIANEGINFKNNFTVYSYCTPSRGTIVTGLYPHKNGAIDNVHTIHPYLPNVGTILDGAGYNTGMIGKFISKDPQSGYDYWLSAIPGYINAKYNYNGTNKTIPGHNTNVLTDSALAFIENSQEPFYLWLGYYAPHDSAIAQPAFKGLYDNEPMPVPDNTQPYSVNYPSFLDDMDPDFYITPNEISQTYEDYYETLAGVDEAIGIILERLESLNIIDNTMIIFTSDNGHMIGEYGLYAKRLAYETSIRTPLFIRYPLWFEDATLINDQITLNTDLAPTIVAAAGIEDTFNFDGNSLKALADYTTTRKDFLYEYFGPPINPYSNIPSIRAVRSLYYKYIFYGCESDTVEEFFDLFSDPEETTNLINNSNYDILVQKYRIRMNLLQREFNDTMVEPTMDCFIANPQFKTSETISDSRSGISIYPNPSDGLFVTVMDGTEKVMVEIVNSLGIAVAPKALITANEKLDLRFLPPGLYFLIYDDGGTKKVQEVIIE